MDGPDTASMDAFDGVVLYTSTPKSGAVAFAHFVAQGKGLVLIHHAGQHPPDSAATPAEVTLATPDHPAVAGIAPFRLPPVEQLYVRPNSTVLLEQHAAGAALPVAWASAHGAGRIYYTAPGQSEAAWALPAFKQSLLQAILWAVGDDVVAAWRAAAPEPLSYSEPQAPIPDYEHPDEKPLKQAPLPPNASIAYMQVPPDFEVALFAAEPGIVNPVAMAWDERGRLWVIETLDYPNNKYPLGEGHDTIKILEDTDGDGHADRVTTFAEGLSIATGLTFSNDGVIVSAPPELLFLKDTDGDDRADVQEVLLDGFLTFDTHAGVSNLRYGFDNWIWMAIGYAGFEGVVGGREHRFKQGLFRLKPDLSALDYLSHFSNNTWGLGFSENGDVFGSTANNQHSVYLAIPDRYFAGVNGFDRTGHAGIAPYKRIHPITDRVRQVDVFGGFTAAAGHALYTARAFPEAYWNRAAFINEPTGHLVHRAWLHREGTQFVARDGWNLLASADEWTAPIMAEVGPDGAVWVLDWYNLIIQHNPVPEGFVAGAGDAYETPLRDREHGRIYRIVYRDAPPYEPVVLRKDDPDGLVRALRHDNLFWRSTAQRLLVERGEADVTDALLALVADTSRDAAGINGGAMHALWTLHGLGSFDGSNPQVIVRARAAMDHPAMGVRRAAVRVLPPEPGLWPALEGRLLDPDEDALVVLDALLKTSELPADAAVGRALYEIQRQPRIARDAWLPTALAIAAAKHHTGYLDALLADPSPDLHRDVTPVDVPNASFEVVDGDLPAGWSVETYTWPLEETNPNVFTYRVVSVGRTGKALEIASPTGADVGIYVTVPVKPATNYMLSGWIKARGVENVGGGYGAVIEVQGFGRTRTVRGTSDWTWVERRFNSGAATEVRIQCHLGRWGQYKGTAWFDDLRLVELGEVSPAAAVAETVLRHVGAGGLDDPALMVLERLAEAAPAVRSLALESFAENWPAGRRPPRAPADEAIRSHLDAVLSSAEQIRLDAWLARWAGVVAPDDRPDPDAQVVHLQAGVNTLAFVQDTLTVRAGRPVELVFENPDAMPHNVVIGRPRSLAEIGAAADALAAAPDGLEKGYVPDSEKVIAASGLVDAGGRVVLRFAAPAAPGDYPFVCTFPGHWRTMNGVLRVTL